MFQFREGESAAKKAKSLQKKRREIPGYWAGSKSKENRKRLVPKNVSVILGLSASSRPEEMWASYNTPVAPAALTPSNGMTRRRELVFFEVNRGMQIAVAAMACSQGGLMIAVGAVQ